MKRLLTVLLLTIAQLAYAGSGDIKIWTMKSGYSITFPADWRRVKSASQPDEYKEIAVMFNHYIPHVAYVDTMEAQWYQNRDPLTWLVLHAFKQPPNSGMKETFAQIPTILQSLGLVVENSGVMTLPNANAKWWYGTTNTQLRGYLVCFGNNDFSCLTYFVSESMDTEAINSYNNILNTFQFPN